MEAKYNGWRAWVHNPTGAMFNRNLQPLSIRDEFKPALAQLKQLPWEWTDAEALERRHKIGQGSLILLDYLPPANETHLDYIARKYFIHACAAVYRFHVHRDLARPIQDNAIYLPMTWRHDSAEPRPGITPLWDILQQCNRALGCEFFEGFVAKRNDSRYPRQNRSASQEFPFWMKHRWNP